MHHQKNLIYLIRGLGFQRIMRNYLYKGNSARIYRLFKLPDSNNRKKNSVAFVWVAMGGDEIAHLTYYLCNFKRKEWCKGGEIRNFFSIFVGK